MNSNFACLTGLAGALALVLAVPASSPAQSRREGQDYGRATNMFSSRLFLPAEGAFSNFVTLYTNSALRTNAILYWARSRIELSNYAGALELLQKETPAGKPPPDFVFWTAQAYYGEGQYTHAIERLKDFAADPPLPLRAALLQAQALSKMPDWPGVIALLSKPEGAFQTAVRAEPDAKEAVDGHFLLGEAYFKQKEFAPARSVIAGINPDRLVPELQWQRQYLLCLISLQDGQTEEALTGSGNLPATESTPAQRVATAFLRGEILERSNRPEEAMEAYSDNLATNLPAEVNPAEVNRQAFAKTIALKLQQNEPSNTMQWLEDFIKQRPNDPVLDLARFHLGDLQLKARFQPAEPGTNGAPPADTNLLSSAITNLDQVIHDFTNSEVLGAAYLDRGWCDWTQGKFAGATNDFYQAANRLPYSEAQAVALLKVADACFQQGDYTNAVARYNQLINDYATMESVTNQLFDLALYQLVQANLQIGDGPAALAAAEHILHWFPISGFGDQSLMLLGEYSSNRKGDYPRARATFQELLEKYPDTPLRPDIQLAIARTFEQQGDWSSAFSTYTDMESQTNFATNTLFPQVEFSLALACWKAGLETNALMRMSNFVSQFPTNQNAALAQNWIGNYYLNRRDYFNADYAFQQASTNAGKLVWESRLMAGLAAFKHQDFTGASNEFEVLVSDTNTPAPFLALAQFQFGYTLLQQFQRDRTNDSLLKGAITELKKVAGSSNALAPLAAGQLGNCFYLAWTDLNKSNTNAYTYNDAYTNATNWYQTLLLDTNDSPVDVTARSEGEFGLGLMAERMRQTGEALTHYCNVLYDTDTTKADPAWIKDAGVKAAALYKEQKNWSGAKEVYRRVRDVVPSLRDEMQKNIDQIEAAGN